MAEDRDLGSALMNYFAFETGTDLSTIFIIASNFKNVACFKNKLLRDKKNVEVAVVWYSSGTDGSLLRVGGNVHYYNCKVSPGKIDYKVIK